MATVVVPWRPGCPHRQAAWQWVKHRYETAGYPVVEGTCPDGPWVKALAVADAISQTDDDVLIVADADVWCPGLPEAIERIATRPVVIPHGKVIRLTEHGTRQYMAGERWPEAEDERRGMAGGGMVILTRDTWNRAPLDPRFRGWGQEDSSWATALTTITGKICRFSHPLIHLWHPPQPRMNRATGSVEGRDLEARYLDVARDPARMEALLAEAWEGGPHGVRHHR